ncbi:hypothetical protein FEM08_05770 [Flavobacterium gilvum]|nr:hypothetical protein FEM08_05770 [Flavobacterium gilvum]
MTDNFCSVKQSALILESLLSPNIDNPNYKTKNHPKIKFSGGLYKF